MQYTQVNTNQIQPRFLLLWLLALFAVGVYWARLEMSYQQQIAAAEQAVRLRADEAAHSLAMQSLTQLRSMDFIVSYMGGLWERDNPQAFRQLVERTAGFLSTDYLSMVAVTDVEGKVLFSHYQNQEQQPAVGISLADRAYFQQHSAVDGAHFSISPPVRNKMTGEWTIQYSHSLIRDGKFDGLVLASVSAHHLSEAFLSVYPDPADVVFLVLDSGEYLTHNHHAAQLAAPAVEEHGYRQQTEQSQGFYEMVSSEDGIKRYHSWYRIEGYPVVLSLGLGRDKIIRPLQDSISLSRQHNLAGAGLLLVGLAWALLLLQRKNEQHQQLIETRERLFTLLRHFPAGVLLEDENGIVVTANNRFSRLMGLDRHAEQLTGISHMAMLARLDARRAQWLPLPDNSRRQHQRIEVDAGSGQHYEVHWIPIRQGRQALGQFWLLLDISERKRRENELQLLASTDSLTGLNNRRSFMLFFEQLGAVANLDDSSALLMMDIDHFKQVNDSYGHPVGDLVLQSVAKIIRNTLRKQDLAGRLGGEEFAVYLTKVSPEQALKLAERLRSSIADSHVVLENGQQLSVTICIGLCMLDGQSLPECLVQADQALYAAKASGRNRVVVAQEPA